MGLDGPTLLRYTCDGSTIFACVGVRSQWRESNPRPAYYEYAALASELHRLGDSPWDRTTDLFHVGEALSR